MKKMMNNTILITGAAGNLGGLLANFLKDRNLHLLTHKKEVSEELKNRSNIKIFKADLKKQETLYPAMKGVNTVVHFAGILFKANPEKFLPITNTLYFNNLLDVAIEQGVQRIILISFSTRRGRNNTTKSCDRTFGWQSDFCSRSHTPARRKGIVSQMFRSKYRSRIFAYRNGLWKRNFVRIGQVSYYGDTTRMRNELLPKLKYKTFEDGLETF